MSDEGVVPRKYKELLQLISERQAAQTKIGESFQWTFFFSLQALTFTRQGLYL
jgi:hypothetical protein